MAAYGVAQVRVCEAYLERAPVDDLEGVDYVTQRLAH
eukprot:CAMPEP_0118882054 /NCGR_PEP_ID=MMETSP1163-20130328/21401_1 /TAXON_ID=124430 /ORGANISM="Phaeomonas parva, Strain CCMP2877" /LENGTH=36 /DNA_ID= /DNA_START= /DNA_END= /DNA_ORIENTATION=